MGVTKLSPVDPFDESKGYYSKEEEALVLKDALQKMPRSALLAQLAALEAENERLKDAIEAVREQAILYGFTGETVANMPTPLTRQEMTAWWQECILFLSERKEA